MSDKRLFLPEAKAPACFNDMVQYRAAHVGKQSQDPIEPVDNKIRTAVYEVLIPHSQHMDFRLDLIYVYRVAAHMHLAR